MRIPIDIRLYPVVTFVLYYGKDEWDAATDLHGMLDFIRCSKDDESMRQSKMIIPKEAGSICAKLLMI